MQQGYLLCLDAGSARESQETTNPIRHCSQTIFVAVKNYYTTYHECYSLVWAILLLRPCLEGQTFTIHTDQDALKLILHHTNLTGPLTRWRLCSSEFYFEVIKTGQIEIPSPHALVWLEPVEPTTYYSRKIYPSWWWVDSSAFRTTGKTEISWQILCMWKLRGHSRWCASHNDGSSCNCASKSIHLSTKEAPTLEELLQEQAAESGCRPTAQGSGISTHVTSMSVTKFSKSIEPADGAPQKLVSITLLAHILLLVPLSQNGRTPEGKPYSMYKHSYFLHIENDV